MRVSGKVALISGGSGGIGAASAKLLASEGAAVVIADILVNQGKVTEAQIAEAGGRVQFVPLDVTNEESWRWAVKNTIDNFGRLDIVVNSAGVVHRAGVEETTVKDWDRVMDVNVKGVFLGTRAAIPEMRKAGGGSIINISSINGLVGSPASASYHASKGAVRIFSKSAAIQHAKDNIRVNSVHPGYVDSPMTQAYHDLPEVRQERIGKTPIGRMGTPEDIALGILYLASDESSFVTGSELVIDGGTTAQ